MPAFVPTQGNAEAFLRPIQQMQTDIRAIQHQLAALGGALLIQSAEYAGVGFAPSFVNTWEQPATGGNPTIFTQVGTSGRVLLVGSATIITAALGQQGIMGYSYTIGATTVGPSGSTELAVFGMTSGASSGADTVSTATGATIVTGLTPGQIEFDGWYFSSGAVGAEFQAMTLIAWPL